jgi:chromosome segregation ATPase
MIATNKEKKKLMDQYIRNVRVIEDAFEQIKDASGISNIEEIVTTFVKAEEQNHSLYNYVNMLNTETDVLEESNRDIKDQINRIVERGQMTENEKKNLQKQLESECTRLESEIDRNLKEADETKKTFLKVQPSVERMIKDFAKTKFFLSVAHKQHYEQGFNFNEGNIIGYLAELEEYIAILITYLATKRDDPVAPFALVPLDKLDVKNHNKKEIAVRIFPINHFFIDRGSNYLCFELRCRASRIGIRYRRG